MLDRVITEPTSNISTALINKDDQNAYKLSATFVFANEINVIIFAEKRTDKTT